MKKSRNMVYSNTQSGGFFNPMMNYNYMAPSGFQGANNYMAYGPNVVPNMMAPIDNYGYQDNNYQYDEENYEQRISKLERQMRKLETRVSKLESSSDILLDDTNNNMYMI